MKKIVLLIAAMSIVLCGFAQHKMSSKEVPSFKKVYIQGRITATIVPAATAQLSAEVVGAEDISKFSWYVKDECLYVKLKKGIKEVPSAAVRIGAPVMEELAVIESDVTVEQFNSPMFDLIASAKSNVVLAVISSDMNIDVRGNSIVKLSGRSKYLQLSATSNSTVDACDLEVISADVVAKTMSEVKVNVAERLAGKADTKALLQYAGNPTILRLETSTRGKTAIAPK